MRSASKELGKISDMQDELSSYYWCGWLDAIDLIDPTTWENWVIDENKQAYMMGFEDSMNEPFDYDSIKHVSNKLWTFDDKEWTLEE
jgi:hypothetical protein